MEHKSGDEGMIQERLSLGPGYRVYLGRKKHRLVLLLLEDKSIQGKDISHACRYWKLHQGATSHGKTK